MRLRNAAVCLLCLALLTGCSTGSIYSNYREIERLLVVQTVGVDLSDNGKTILSVCAGRLGGEAPVRLWAEADTLDSARDKLQSFVPDKELFYPHAAYVLVGERAAKAGLGGLLDYIARAVETRIDTPVLVVRDGEARDLVLKVGGGGQSVTGALETLRRGVERRGGAGVQSAADMIRSLQDGGAALLCAVEAEPAGAADPAAKDGELAAAPAGCAVFLGDSLAGYVREKDARGVSLLTGGAALGPADVTAAGEPVSVIIDGGSCAVSPVWDGDGRICRLRVRAQLTAGLGEMREPEELEAGYLAELDGALAEEAAGWLVSVLTLSGELGADFLGLGRRVEVKEPEKYRAMPEPFSSQLPGIAFDVTCEAAVERSYDLTNPAQSTRTG